MKIKGISPLERNVEKFVLGAVGVVFLAVLALQFVRQPNTVMVDNRALAPADAFTGLEARAEKLMAEMNAVDPAVATTRPPVDLMERFSASTGGDVAPAPRLAWSPPGIDLGAQDLASAPQLGTAIVEVVPPAPRNALANVTEATVHPSEAADSPALAAILPPQQPFDKQTVTVEAVFDGTALRAALLADPDGDQGAAPMPPSWWQNSIQVLGVRLIRQEQAPTGEWTNEVEVPAMPGRNDLVTQAAADTVSRKSDLDAIVAQAAAKPEQARRPETYRTIAGPAWVSPREALEAVQTGGVKSQIERLLSSREDRSQQLATLEEQAGRVPEARVPQPGRNEDRGGGKGRGSGQPTPPSPDNRSGPRPPSAAAIERQIKLVRDQIARIDRDLQSLGYQPRDAAPAGQPASKAKPLLDDPAVRVWAHDVTAQPGKTYRYGVRVVVNNPAFDRAAFISSGQAGFAGTPVLFSAPSEWTSPVTVDPMECFFIVSAVEGGEGPLAATRATAEMYRFYYGYWRQGKVNLEPGDILASAAKLPELFAFDLARMDEPPPEGVEPSPPDGGGRGIAPGGVPGEPPAGEPPAAPPGQVPLERNLPIVLNAVLLDVARVPGGLIPAAGRLSGGAPNQALIRDSTGNIVTRIPEQDRASALYQRVSESAREGLSQGAPPPPEAAPEGERPPPGQPSARPPETPPSKGGGGGGGGGGG